MAQRPTGPQPITTATVSEWRSEGREEKALRAAKKPVGN